MEKIRRWMVARGMVGGGRVVWGMTSMTSDILKWDEIFPSFLLDPPTSLHYVLFFFVLLFVLFFQTHSSSSELSIWSILVIHSIELVLTWISVILTVLAVCLMFHFFSYFYFFYDLLYSPLALLDYFFSFFRATPILPHLPMYSCDPLPSSYSFRTSQLYQRKICSIIDYFLIFLQFWPFFLVVYPILFLPLFYSHLSFIFFNHGLYTFSHSHTTYLQQTNYQAFPPKKHFYNHFLTLELSSLWKNKLVIICFITYLSTYTGFSLFLDFLKISWFSSLFTCKP